VLSPWGRLAGREKAIQGDENEGEHMASSEAAVWHTGKANEQTVLRAVGRELAVSLEEAASKIVYDGGKNVVKAEMVDDVRVVIVGRQKTNSRQAGNLDTLQHYVLVVGRIEEESVGMTYRRLGVGVIAGRWIKKEERGEKIVIV